MGLEITIDDIKAKTEEKFGPVTIPLGEAGTAVLLHIIRLPKDRKEAFKQKVGEFQELQVDAQKMQQEYKDAAAAAEEDPTVQLPDFDQETLENRMGGLIGDLITIVCLDPKTAVVLLEMLPDYADRMTLFQTYMENAQPGEASPSPS